MLDEGRRIIGLKGFEAWKAAGMRNTVVLHTGMGKTFVGLDAACYVKSLCTNNAKVVFLAETVQREQELIKDIEFYQKCYPDAVIPTIEFACYQSAYKWKNIDIDLLIMDEAHDGCSPEYIKVLLNNNIKYIIGLTATPYSEREYKLEKEDITKVNLMERHIPICFTYGLTDAIRDGNSRKLNVHIIHHRLDEIDKCIEGGTAKSTFFMTEAKAYKHYNDKFWQGIYDESLKYLVNIYMQKRAKLIYSLPSKFKASKDILDNIEGRTLVFANDLSALESITSNVIRSPKEGETSKTRNIENKRIREDFESGRTNVLASYKILQQGANIKGGIDNLLIISYHSNLGSLVQKIGRLRIDGDKEGNVIIFMTLNTVEEKWFKKMMSQLDTSVFNVKKHADVESFIETLK
jgi:superfamily II DNA or RNA helicase